MTAINFPDSPSNGDTHVVGGVIYTYDSTETKWKTTINSNAFLPLTGGTVSGNIVLGGEIQHDGDTDTNISFDADTIKFDTAGSERFRVDSSGRVGIGTTSPAYKCDIDVTGSALRLNSTTTGAALVISSDDAANAKIEFGDESDNDRGAIIYDNPNNALIFQANAAERARIDSSGNFKFNSGYGSVATAYGCRAWVNFNGVGTVAIRASGNVSSITDNGTGDYTVNFTTAMPDANYCVTGTCSGADNPSSPVAILNTKLTSGLTTTGCRVFSTNNSSAAANREFMAVAIFR